MKIFISSIGKKIGIVLLIFMMLTPSWGILVNNTNNSTPQLTKNQNKNLISKTYTLKNPKKTKNTITRIYENKQPQKQVETNNKKNKPVKTNYVNYMWLKNVKTNFKVVQSENRSENNINLIELNKQYNQTKDEYSSVCNDLDELKAFKSELETEHADLINVEKLLENERNTFVFNSDNKDKYDDLCSKINTTKTQIKEKNILLNEITKALNKLDQRRNDYETILTTLNQTLKKGKITTQEINTIKTVIQRYNQTITNNTSQKTETENTRPTTTDNNNNTLKIIESSNTNNNTTNDTTNNYTTDDYTSFYTIDGTILGINLLTYGTSGAILYKVLSTEYKAPLTICNNYLRLLGELTHKKTSTTAEPAIPSAASGSGSNNAEPAILIEENPLKIAQKAYKEALARYKLATENYDHMLNFQLMINDHSNNIMAEIEQVEIERNDFISVVGIHEFNEYDLATKTKILSFENHISTLEKQLEYTKRTKQSLVTDMESSFKNDLKPAEDEVRRTERELGNLKWNMKPSDDCDISVAPLEYKTKDELKDSLLKLSCEDGGFRDSEFVQKIATETERGADNIACDFVEVGLKRNNALERNIFNSPYKLNTARIAMDEYGLDAYGSSIPRALNTLLSESLKDPEVLGKIAAINEKAGVVLCEGGEARVVGALSKSLYVSSVFWVVNVIMDVWMAASVISWAGKEFGWWNKDYVNDFLSF